MNNGHAAPMATDILLVDDDPSGLAMLTLALRRVGFSVEGCTNPNCALERLRQERFRWLVTDARMSHKDGFALAQAAKELQADLRIVMISALASDHDIDGRPIERVFAKPIPFEALVSWLRSPQEIHLQQ